VPAGDIDSTNPRTGSQQQFVVAQAPAVRYSDRVRSRIDLGNANAELDIDSILIVKASGFERDAISRNLPRQEFLRQRRALIREMRLIAKDRYVSIEPGAAERGRRLDGSLPCSHDYKVLVHCPIGLLL
jgi:hypothetical protein